MKYSRTFTSKLELDISYRYSLSKFIDRIYDTEDIDNNLVAIEWWSADILDLLNLEYTLEDWKLVTLYFNILVELVYRRLIVLWYSERVSKNICKKLISDTTEHYETDNKESFKLIEWEQPYSAMLNYIKADYTFKTWSKGLQISPKAQELAKLVHSSIENFSYVKFAYILFLISVENQQIYLASKWEEIMFVISKSQLEKYMNEWYVVTSLYKIFKDLFKMKLESNVSTMECLAQLISEAIDDYDKVTFKITTRDNKPENLKYYVYEDNVKEFDNTKNKMKWTLYSEVDYEDSKAKLYKSKISLKNE